MLVVISLRFASRTEKVSWLFNRCFY